MSDSSARSLSQGYNPAIFNANTRRVMAPSRLTPGHKHVSDEFRATYLPAARTPGKKHYSRSRSRSKGPVKVGSRARTTDIKLGSAKRVMKQETGLRAAAPAVEAAKGHAEEYARSLGRKCNAAKFGHNANAQVSKAMLAAVEPSRASEIATASKPDTKKGSSNNLPKASVLAAFREGLGDGQITDSGKYALQALVTCELKELSEKAGKIAKASGRNTVKQRDVALAAGLCA